MFLRFAACGQLNKKSPLNPPFFDVKNGGILYPMILKNAIFPIGQITKAHGLRGELSFTTTSTILEDVDVKFILLEPEGLLVPFYLEHVRMKTDTTGLLKLERIDSEEQAREYTGLTIYLPNTFLDEIDNSEIETEYFVGFEITDEEKGSIGRVLAVDQSTANALFVVETESGEVLIPVADEYITGIDHNLKIITVNLPEGLLDL